MNEKSKQNPELGSARLLRRIFYSLLLTWILTGCNGAPPTEAGVQEALAAGTPTGLVNPIATSEATAQPTGTPVVKQLEQGEAPLASVTDEERIDEIVRLFVERFPIVAGTDTEALLREALARDFLPSTLDSMVVVEGSMAENGLDATTLAKLIRDGDASLHLQWVGPFSMDKGFVGRSSFTFAQRSPNSSDPGNSRGDRTFSLTSGSEATYFGGLSPTIEDLELAIQQAGAEFELMAISIELEDKTYLAVLTPSEPTYEEASSKKPAPGMFGFSGIGIERAFEAGSNLESVLEALLELAGSEIDLRVISN